MMYYYIGISFLAGVGVIFLSVGVNFIIGKYSWSYYQKQMVAKDQRTKATTEMLSQMKFIKMNALENYFIEKVLLVRTKELSIIRTWFLIVCLQVLSVYITPMLIINGTFALYVGLNNQMSAASTFTIISLFQVLQGPLLMLPQSVSSLI
jgi:ABC-type multidrug transport system fused ATPase/permease subunit